MPHLASGLVFLCGALGQLRLGGLHLLPLLGGLLLHAGPTFVHLGAVLLNVGLRLLEGLLQLLHFRMAGIGRLFVVGDLNRAG